MRDEKIIELYNARDESAIDETKNKYGKYIYTVAYNLLSSREDAEECENDTYLSAWQSIPPNRPECLSAFLAGITRNLSMKRLREKKAARRGGGERAVPIHELEECLPDDRDMKSDDIAEALNAFLGELGETERNVFVLRYWYCLSIKDVAEKYGFGRSKVKMMLLRSREKLTECLKKRGIYL